MFYRPGQDDHGLPHDPFKAVVSPRPIGWISTRNHAGQDNLAPYSFFNGISDSPPMVMFATAGQKIGIQEDKDSLSNIRESKEFCVNFVSYALRDAMNLSSGQYAHGEDEFEIAGLEKSDSKIVSPPFVKDAPAAFECKLYKIVDLPGTATMVIGEVVGIHLADEHLVNGIFDVTSYQPLSRLGYKDYAVVREVFSLDRPE